MPRSLTHKSILLLARRRLGEIYRALDAKVRSGGPVSDLERRVAHLARKAYEMVSVPPHPPLEGALAADPLVEGVSTYAVMGSMGPDFSAFSAVMVEGNNWIFDTVHKGSPDGNLEWVHAGTTDFAIVFWEKVREFLHRDLPMGDPERDRARERALERMRAYVLGHLAHVASDSISHPWINDVQWRVPPPLLGHDAVERALDAAVAEKVLGRSSLRSGQAWDVWWPTAEEVPEQFKEAYAEALETVYQLRSRRRTGLAEFERAHTEHHPPDLDPALIGEGYKFFRNGVMNIGYSWDWYHWFGLLAPFVIPILAAPYAALGTPKGSKLFAPAQPGEDFAGALWELYTPPLSFGAITTTAYGVALLGLIGKGIETFYETAIVGDAFATFLGLVAIAIAFLGADASSAVRWTLLLALPALLWLLPPLVVPRKPKRKTFVLIQLLPVLALGVYAVCSLFILLSRGSASSDGMIGWSIAFLGVWSVIWIVLWFVMSFRLRDGEVKADKVSLVSDDDHPVRLFDDGTLRHDPPVAAPSLAQRFFPSGRRKLLKLWWEGAGSMSVRSDRFQLVFRSAAGAETIVRAPIEPLNLDGYRALLERTLPGLKGQAVEPTNLDYILPAGATFADHAEDEESDPVTAEEHARLAAEFRTLKTTPAAADYVLYHAPKVVQSVEFGTSDPIDPNAFGIDDGLGFVHDPAAEGGGRVMDFAADFAALLMLGGASRLMPEGERAVDRAGRAESIHQVFRNWDLDRRRVNEWRMIVAGGAFSEKGAHPEGPDPLMPRDTPANWTSPLFNAGVRAPFDEGEATARRLGWVPLLRKWLDVARRPGQDVLANERFNPNDPPPHAMSRGIAYLLDMTDPVSAR